MPFVFLCFCMAAVHVALKVISYYTEAAAAAAEHNSSGRCVFVSAPGLLGEIERRKEGEPRFVPQSLSFVRADMEEGVKQLDKMALMCLKNLLSLIKAHTHARQKQTERTRFSAASAERLLSSLSSWLPAPAVGVRSALLCVRL